MAKRRPKPEPDDASDEHGGTPHDPDDHGSSPHDDTSPPPIDVQPGRPARVTQHVVGDGWIEVGVALKLSAHFQTGELTAALRLPLHAGETPKQGFLRVQGLVDTHVASTIPDLENLVELLVAKRRTIEDGKGDRL